MLEFDMSVVEIFFSYAHEDEELMNAVRRQLIPFDRQKLLTKWYDREIQAGQEWRGQIDEHLKSAGIILLFVSPYFFESDYIYDVEMAEALKRHENGEAIVIPVILRPCAWQTAPFGYLQAVPKEGRPITSWSNQDEACLDVANHIVKVVRHFDEIRNAHRRPSSTAPRSKRDEQARTKAAHNEQSEIEQDISQDQNVSKVPIIVAVIGLVGVLATALFNNWDKLFPRDLTSPTAAQPSPTALPSSTVAPTSPGLTPHMGPLLPGIQLRGGNFSQTPILIASAEECSEKCRQLDSCLA